MIDWNWLDVGHKRNHSKFISDCHYSLGIRTMICTFSFVIGIFAIGAPLDLAFGLHPSAGIPIGMVLGFMIPWLFFGLAPRLHVMYSLPSKRARDTLRRYLDAPPAAQKEIGSKRAVKKTIREANDSQVRSIDNAMGKLIASVEDRDRELAKTLPPSAAVRRAEMLEQDLTDRAEAIRAVVNDMRMIS